MRKVFLTSLFALFCLALCWSGPLDIPSSSSNAQNPPTISQRLGELATTLEQALMDSQSDWDQLSLILTAHSKKLEELVTLSKGSEQEMASIRKSLSESEKLLESLIKDKQALEFRLKIGTWMGVGGVVLGVGIGMAGFALIERIVRK